MDYRALQERTADRGPHQRIPSGIEAVASIEIRIYGCNLRLTHFHRLRAWQTGATIYVVGGTQRQIHQLKQRVEQALCRPQGEIENALEHEKGTDGLVGVEGASSPSAMMFLMEPVMNDILINPER